MQDKDHYVIMKIVSWSQTQSKIMDISGKLQGMFLFFEQGGLDMWTVIYITPNKIIAEKYKKALSDEGMLVQLRPIGSAHLGDHASVEILVPESEAEEAHEIITGLMGS